MATTAQDQIYGALRLLGVLAEGEAPSTYTTDDALLALNQMIDSWNTERLSVYTIQEQVFTWPATQVSRTLGPSGNFVGNRPILLDDATFFVDSATGVSHPVSIINHAEYNSIALKTATGTYPQVISIEMTYPDVTMSVYPVPSVPLDWHFVSVLELAQPATLGTTLSLPPGYLRAFRYNLACELAPEFGVEPSPTVQRVAMDSKRNLKRVNNPGDVMSFPASIVSNFPGFNVYNGY